MSTIYLQIQQIASNNVKSLGEPANELTQRNEVELRIRSQSETSQSSIGDVQNPSKVHKADAGSTGDNEIHHFEEVELDGETYCLVPKKLSKYIPRAPVELREVNCVGQVEVGEHFAYVPVDLLPKMTEAVFGSLALQDQVRHCRNLMWEKYGSSIVPPFEPEAMREICHAAGADKLFDTILEAMSTDDQSIGREKQNEKRVVAVIYMLMFGQSQKANWFQKILANEVVSKGVSGTGLSMLNKTGVAVSKSTQKRELAKVAASHEKIVMDFVQDAYEKNDLLVLMVDDYTNIHTKQRPKDQETSSARSMATVLLKRFCGVPAIPQSENTCNPSVVDKDLLTAFVAEGVAKISGTYASVMPHWIRAAFLDPEAERHRVGIHDYQQQQSVRGMRKMVHCRLIDELELPLKSFSDFLVAAKHAIHHGLGKYLSEFVCPQPGDWPAQFYMRQIQYSVPLADAPTCLGNIVPFIGPLHVQLNARECVCLLHIDFFKKAYSWIFGKRKVLATKPKAWRISLIEELVYGGWTLIREHVTVAFSKCKDLQYLTLLNLLDNHLPLVLSIYSIIFKNGNTKQYVDAMFRCWVMFFSFKRHHYDKAPLVWLSNFLS